METYIDIKIKDTEEKITQFYALFRATQNREKEVVSEFLTESDIDIESWQEHLNKEDFWSIESISLSQDLLEVSYLCGSGGFDQLYRIMVLLNVSGCKYAIAKCMHDEDESLSEVQFIELKNGKAKRWTAEVESGDSWSSSEDKGHRIENIKVRSLNALEQMYAREDVENFVDTFIGDKNPSYAALVVLAAFTSAGITAVFTALTVFLFEGLWLWLSLGALLFFLLANYTTSRIRKTKQDFKEIENALSGFPGDVQKKTMTAFMHAVLSNERKGKP